ncbi:MAG TPA: IPT/TIG domain-containing protein [Bryobacteraceae bacterium]|nr:IPT/TIG domain-containing protein [Bryobacteraceae bacterium]
MIAPNTWVEIKGENLAMVGFERIWGASDFVNSAMPTALNGVSAMVNGERAYVYYVSPAQVNILTPPSPISGQVQVTLTTNGLNAAFTAQALAAAPSFFVFGGGHTSPPRI